MSPTTGSETVTLDPNHGKIPASQSIWVSRSTRVSLSKAKRQNIQWWDLFRQTELWNTPDKRLNVTKGTVPKIGKFCSRLDASRESGDCQNIQKDKSCDLCNWPFPKAQMHGFLIFLYFCDISVYFCWCAEQHQKQTLYPICPEPSGTGQPAHRAKIVLPKELHWFRSIEASGCMNSYFTKLNQAQSSWYDWPFASHVTWCHMPLYVTIIYPCIVHTIYIYIYKCYIIYIIMLPYLWYK